jgi:hypothetical protein
MAKRTPTVRGDTLTYQHQEQERVLMVDTPDWYVVITVQTDNDI